MKWININEQAPPKNTEALVYFAGSERIEIDKLVKHTGNNRVVTYEWNYEPDYHIKKTATHWMPLPELPRK